MRISRQYRTETMKATKISKTLFFALAALLGSQLASAEEVDPKCAVFNDQIVELYNSPACALVTSVIYEENFFGFAGSEGSKNSKVREAICEASMSCPNQVSALAERMSGIGCMYTGTDEEMFHFFNDAQAYAFDFQAVTSVYCLEDCYHRLIADVTPRLCEDATCFEAMNCDCMETFVAAGEKQDEEFRSWYGIEKWLVDLGRESVDSSTCVESNCLTKDIKFLDRFCSAAVSSKSLGVGVVATTALSLVFSIF